MDSERLDKARIGGVAPTYSSQDEPWPSMAMHSPPSTSSQPHSFHHSTMEPNRRRLRELETSGGNATKKLKTQSGTFCSSGGEMQLPGVDIDTQLTSSSKRVSDRSSTDTTPVSPTDQSSHSPSTGPERSDQVRTDGDTPTYSSSQLPVADEAPIHPPPSTSSTQPFHSLSSRELSDSDLPVLLTVLGNAAHCSEQLGYKLLPPDLVLTLKGEAMGDLALFLSKVLMVRLRVLPALTIQELADAISQPPINNGALAQKLQQQFLKQPVVHTSVLCASQAMQNFSEYLDAYYQNNDILQGSKGDPTPTNKYINLAVIRKEDTTRAEADKFTKATLHGGIDQIMRKKRGIELTKVFKPEEGQEDVKFVLAEGAPGIGKSTMAWELCRKRQEFQVMRGFSAIVFLPLHDKEVLEARSLGDIIRFVYQVQPNFQQAILEEIESNQGEGLLLILDGFDEVPVALRSEFFLADIIHGKQLAKATVLVTSRPSARADLLKLRKPHKHIEVLGFTPKLVEQYATNAFGSNQQLLDGFFTYISSNPVIKSMMYVPLNCAIVVDTYKEKGEVGRPIPQTMTQLYSELVLTHIWRHLKTSGDPLADLYPDKLEDISQKLPDTYMHLFSLGKLAFDGILKEEVIFDDLPAGCSALGLMTSSRQIYRRNRVSTRHSFFHLTLQEFLSAFYISQLPGSEQKEIFEQTMYQNMFSRMEMVWKFLAGLTGLKYIGWEAFLSRRRGCEEQEKEEEEVEVVRVNPFVVQCIYEAQEKMECEAVLGWMSAVVYQGFLHNSVYDCFAVGYCVSSGRCSWVVEFGNSELGPELVEMLVLGLKSKKEVCGRIVELDLSWSKIGMNGIAHFRELPCSVLQWLFQLNLSQSELDGPALGLLSNVIPSMSRLEYLNISENPAGNGGLVNLLKALAHARSLIHLNICEIAMNGDDIAALSTLLQRSGSLEELIVGGEGMDLACVERLLETVFSPSSLKHLHLVNVNVPPSSSLAPLASNHNIVDLQWAPGFGRCIDIGRALCGNTTLETLSLGFICYRNMTRNSAFTVDQAAARALSDALKVNRSLKVLKVGKYPRMGPKEVQTILDGLQYNQTLEVLELPFLVLPFDQEFSGSLIARSLSNALKVNQSLKVLKVGSIADICMGPEEVRTIVDALQYNQTLEVLCLPFQFQEFSEQDHRIQCQEI